VGSNPTPRTLRLTRENLGFHLGPCLGPCLGLCLGLGLAYNHPKETCDIKLCGQNLCSTMRTEVQRLSVLISVCVLCQTLPSRVPEHGDFVNRPFAVNRSSLRYGPFELLLQFHVRKACMRILVAGKNYKCNLRKPAQTQPPQHRSLPERI